MKEKTELHGITMIPFGLLAGFADGEEIRITELAENGFCFHTAEKIGTISKFRICFYQELCGKQTEKKEESDQKTDQKSLYTEIELTDYEIKETINEEYGISIYEYAVFAEEERYRTCVEQLILQYDRYIHLRLSCEDGELAEALTGYPAKEDGIFAQNLEEQKRGWFQNSITEKNRTAVPKKETYETELAVELDRPELYSKYLSMEFHDFMKWYWKENAAEMMEETEVLPGRIYVGNAFCHCLFPEQKTLFMILEKAWRESLDVTVTSPYLREFMIESVEKLLEELTDWCKKHRTSLEIIANDWGMLELLKGRQNVLKPCLGTLLNKRKKDPRMKYKKGNTELLSENSLNAGFYREYLKREFGIERYEWESCGYGQKFPAGKNSIHVPFYQTNTSQYCTLYAFCKNGDRGRQELPEKCPGYCRENVFLYPKHLNMAGRYNSLFALDLDAVGLMRDPSALRSKGIDRVVVNLL